MAEDRSGNMPFSSHRSKGMFCRCDWSLLTLGCSLSHRAGVVLVSLLHHKATLRALRLPHRPPWKEVSVQTLRRRSGELCARSCRVKHPHNYSEFFCTGDLPLLPHLMIQFVYISMDSWKFILYLGL